MVSVLTLLTFRLSDAVSCQESYCRDPLTEASARTRAVICKYPRLLRQMMFGMTRRISPAAPYVYARCDENAIGDLAVPGFFHPDGSINYLTVM